MTALVFAALRPLFLAAAIALHLSHPLAGSAEAAGFADIELTATPISRFGLTSDATRFGELEFRGGLVLSSPAPSFGGLSGLDFEADGKRFVAVSDLGYWFRGTVERTNGWLTGISEPQWAPILNAEGRPLGAKRNADAEGLRLGHLNGAPVAYVSFEQTNDLKAYRQEPDLALSRPQPIRLPKSAKGIRRNRGFEALALAPQDSPLQGAPVLIAEETLNRAGDHRAFVVNGPLAGEFAVKRRDGFAVTDADFLPNGDLVILERRVIMPLGVQMRLRRIDAARIRPGATVDGPVMLFADMSNQIDNMEGLSVTADPDGRTRLTLVSDDNRSFIQRTILLEFIWLGPQQAAANE
ncbi:MAG: esterase-like activity of phytase family protein [Rhizobiales bacterium]|nr:esterase-like activity of phytase family protein [Hyphomicrobiales bacterium]